jgi:hypothetical protein
LRATDCTSSSDPLDRNTSTHALRATAATNALDHDSDIAKGGNFGVTQPFLDIYDRRKMKPEDSPTFKVSY